MSSEIYLAGDASGNRKYLSLINGVENTQVGYANGKIINPLISRFVITIPVMPKPSKWFMIQV
jgi:peptide methionine sulfoxide reductase MsrA